MWHLQVGRPVVEVNGLRYFVLVLLCGIGIRLIISFLREWELRWPATLDLDDGEAPAPANSARNVVAVMVASFLEHTSVRSGPRRKLSALRHASSRDSNFSG